MIKSKVIQENYAKIVVIPREKLDKYLTLGNK